MTERKKHCESKREDRQNKMVMIVVQFASWLAMEVMSEVTEVDGDRYEFLP
jgi:hypothetical protein